MKKFKLCMNSIPEQKQKFVPFVSLSQISPFLKKLEIEKDRFNAEYLIHLKYMDEEYEKGYVITFRDGSLEDREKKWAEWHGYLEDARTKFQEMIQLQ